MNLKRKLLSIGALVASAALVVVAAAPAQAAGTNLVTNGNFALPVVPSGSATVSSLPGWFLVTGSDFEVVSAGTFTPPAGSAPGTQSVDLNPNGPTNINQLSIPTVAGTTYTFSFDLAGNVNGAPAVKTGVFGTNAGGPDQSFTIDTTGRTGANMGWVHETLTFTASASTTNIGIKSNTAGDFGPVITNVSVVATPDAGGPLADWPIALVSLLALAALLGVGVILRRRGSVRGL